MAKEFEYNGKAMGTTYFIAIVCNREDLADKLYEIGKKEIEEYENKFSRFLPASELSILNKNKTMVVSEEFLTVTKRACCLFVETRGIFNPLVSISRLGYDEGYLHKKVDIEKTYNIDFASTVIDNKNSLIKLKEGQNLDYGGFLKGYLAEIIANKIKSYSEEIEGVIVNIGGDIHTKGLDKDGNKFIFSIYNPILDNEDIKVTLYNESLATSGIYKRFWNQGDKKMHHILDITGEKNPESDFVSVSVIHKEGEKTEAYTKVLFSIGYDKALKLLGEDNILFIIIKDNGQVIRNI